MARVYYWLKWAGGHSLKLTLNKRAIVTQVSEEAVAPRW